MRYIAEADPPTQVVKDAVPWECEILAYRLSGFVVLNDELLRGSLGEVVAPLVASEVAEEVAFKVNEKFAEVLGKWESLAESGDISTLLGKIRQLKSRL